MTRESKILNPESEKSLRAGLRGKAVFGIRRGTFGWLLLGLQFFSAFVASAAFVYETPVEFLSSGDFNGDGIADVLVLDKATGNARVGYQTGAGSLVWSASLITGVENVSGCAIARMLQTTRDAVAVTAPDFNRVNVVDLSTTNSASTPFVVVPTGVGPHTLVGLPKPMNPPPTPMEMLLVASAFNYPLAEGFDLFGFFPGIFTQYGQYNETGPFDRGNALQLTTNAPTFGVGIVRGATNDALHVWQFTNAPGVLTALSNLPPGSDYAFGNFDGEALPRFWFYVPGNSNINIRPLVASGGGFVFGTNISLSFTQAIKRVYYVSQNTNGSAIIQFGDGIQGARLSSGSPILAAKYAVGAGAEFTGVAALDNGRFALLSAPTGSVTSLRAQVMTFNGTNYTQISSNNLPALTTRNTRATVWLFQTEPFTNSGATFIASLNAPDWSSSVLGLPGSLSARVENDGGPSSGLGSPATNSLGTVPAGASYGLPDQYRDDVSFFTYAPPRVAEPVVITIAPPPGIYSGPISISFTKLIGSHQVFYRRSLTEAWQLYSAPFQLTNDATIQYYGKNPSAGTRSALQFAAYKIGSTGETPPAPSVLPGSLTNAPPLTTNVLQLSASGTVFYSRHTALAELENFQGPSPYLSFADSPFNASGFNYFYLEDFEDGALNTPGATPSAGWVVFGPSGAVDSVDAGGRSYYSSGQTNLTITFNAAALGGKLPTHVGIVWTDVGAVSSGVIGFGNVRFIARDASGAPLGTNVGVNLGNGSTSPSAAEDRFFGVVNAGGISSISITMTNSGDWEVDHLQYGYLDSAGFNDSIWAINLDGNGETFVAEGAHPRVSRDGQWLAFLREGHPYSSQGNLWVKNLQTGAETRFFTNASTIVSFDWNWPQAELIFDNACVLLRRGLSGPVTQLPAVLTPECFNGAPVVNPLDGRLAFQNVNPGGPQGVYVTPPNWSARTRLTEPTTLRLRWPAWSPDGARLAMADRTSSAFINTGVNLWTAAADGSNLHQITELAEPNGFPRGAIWTPDGRALVGAGRIGGINGLWVIPLAANGEACQCPPRLLPTSPGSEIDFAGSVVAALASPSGPAPGLFIRKEPNAIVVYWSTSFDGYALEFTTNLAANVWTPISGPYFLAGSYYEYREANGGLQSTKFFRLRYPGVLILTPFAPEISFRLESNRAVLDWPLSYAGFTLETTTNLSPPIAWTPLTAPYVITNGMFEYQKNLSGSKPREFFRLRWP